jgi:hypothetical protein
VPVIGPLDDLVMVLALRYVGRRVSREVLLVVWPGESRLIEWLLEPVDRGPAAAS